jgi:nucleoside-diphosphate-sugar epimerase
MLMKGDAMKVAVTGASGFIGRRAVRHLRHRGCEVHTIGRAPSAPTDGVTHHQFDLLRDDRVLKLFETIRPTHLLHLAWNTTPGSYWETLDNLEWVSASLRLARAFAEVGGTRMAAAGTCAEYEWVDSPFEWHPLPFNECRTPLVPQTLYGTAKKSTYALIHAAAPKLGVSLAWGRVFFVYGPGEAAGRLIPEIAAALLQGRHFDCSDGRQKRDYLHVDDVGRAFSELLLSDVQGPVNIASGSSVSVREIVDQIASLIGRSNLVRFGARISHTDEPAEIVGDVTRLRSEVGFKPSIPIDTGLRETVDWWRKAGLARNAR